MTLLINLLGLILIAFIISWFWLANRKTEKSAAITHGTIDILVDNGVYTPAIIKIKRGEKFNLRFIRKDPTPCSEWVIFQKLDISQQLPLKKPYTIELIVNNPGEYEFTCQMGMYRGKLLVEE